MNSLNQISTRLNEHKFDLKKRYNIKQLGIFGSYSRGEQIEKSDVDILVEFEKPIGFGFCFIS